MNAPSQRLVVINADDLGLTEGVTAGILEAMEAGLVTDASLLACGQAFDQAVAGLRRLGRGVGVHLSAVDRERPLSDFGPACRLTGPDGCFLTNRNALFARLLATPGAVLGQLGAEWRAQVERVAATGLPLTHLDSHQHLHLFPGLCGLALSLARVRLSRPVSLAVNLLSGRLARAIDRAGLRRVGFAGLEDSGRQDPRGLIRALALARDPVVELAFHPGHADQVTRKRYAHWGFDWEGELAALSSPDFRRFLDETCARTVSFDDLARL